MLTLKYIKNKFNIIGTPPLSMVCFEFKNDKTGVLKAEIFFWTVNLFVLLFFPILSKNYFSKRSGEEPI